MNGEWYCSNCGAVNHSDWDDCAACLVRKLQAEVEQLRARLDDIRAPHAIDCKCGDCPEKSP